ncbi:MAG: sensor histidine kinase, partial [Spirochaetia bacterium]|nr:sensor histidine kinase [Spirochaetia bacterium]
MNDEDQISILTSDVRTRKAKEGPESNYEHSFFLKSVNGKYVYIEIQWMQTFPIMLFYECGGEKQTAENINQSPYPVFKIYLPADKVCEIHFQRMYSEAYSNFPPKIFTENAFHEYAKIVNSYFGFYFGILFGALIFNLFAWSVVRKSFYKDYILYIIFYGIYQFTVSGYSGYLIEDGSFMFRVVRTFSACFLTVFFINFTRNFLQLGKYSPVFYRLLPYFNTLVIFAAFLFFFIEWKDFLRLTQIFFYLFVILPVIATVSVYLKDKKQAFVYALPFSFLVTGVMVYALLRQQLIPLNLFTLHAYQIGSIVEIILFSIVLAAQYNKLRTDKEILKQNLITANEKIISVMKEEEKKKDEFLAMTAHELKSPLHAIHAISGLLGADLGSAAPPQVLKQLEVIDRSALRLNNLVNDILDYSLLKDDRISLEITDLHLPEVVNSALDLLNYLVKDYEIQLKTNIPDISILADHERM